MLQVEDTAIRFMMPMSSMCLVREICFNERQIMTVKLYGDFDGNM